MKKIGTLVLALMLTLVFTLSGCGQTSSNSSSSQKPKTITVKDSKGGSVTVPFEPKRVVVMNNAVAEIIYVLGGKDKIVGVSNDLKFPEDLAKKPKVGKAFTPDIEKVMEMKPDLVFGYGQYVKKEQIDKLKAAGITFISIDGFKIKSLDSDIETIGKIFNKQDKAKQYVSFIDKYVNLVKDRTSKLKPEEKVSAYWEGYSDYTSVSKGASGDEMLSIAGINNIAKDQSIAYPKVSNEWILEKNPQYMIKEPSTKISFGYKINDLKAMNQFYNKFISRTGWEKIDAVKNKKVYIMSDEIATSARSVVGICYLAKLCYPNLFKDLNPENVHKEMLKQFYNIDYNGNWVYPKQ